MLFQLRLVSDRRGGLDQSAFTRLGPNADLLPANEAAMDMAIVVARQPADVPASGPVAADPGAVAPGAEIARMLPQLSLEIRAALDTSLRKELADLRGFLGTALDGHAERLQGDLATLMPPSRAPDVDMPTMISGRRPWAAILGWSFALLATACAAWSTWLWWNQGGEIAALRTDLAAAYAEAETLRARPTVVSVPAPVEAPPALSPDAMVAAGTPPEGAAAATISADANAAAEADAAAAAGAAPVSTAPATIAPASPAAPSAVPPAAAVAHPAAAHPAATHPSAAQPAAPVAPAPATAQPAQAR
jgi:hypothetical protein